MDTKRFDIVTESDARRLEPGSTIVLAAGGHVTPLARDTLRERRITVLSDDVASVHAAGLAPAADVRRVIVGSDHTGVAMKASIVGMLRSRGLAAVDAGTDGTAPADYPDIAALVARAVARGEADAGIVIDGGGIGSAIAANKIAGIRAAMCVNQTLARYAREHNGANVLALGSMLVTTDEAHAIVQTFLGSSMREPRYMQRLAKIAALERR